MITLTDKETLLAQELLNSNDDTDCHICNEDFIDYEQFGWNVDTLKGVFGSLVFKGLLNHVDENDNGEIYQWEVPVASCQQSIKLDNEKEYEIKDVSDLLFQFNKHQEERAKNPLSVMLT